MRTQEEILAKIQSITDTEDFFGVKRSDLVDYLNFDNAKPFLTEGAQEHDWNEHQKHDPAKEALEYLPFAWDKANNFRGLSAERSLDHFSVWIWLMGKDELLRHLVDYNYYGKPQLVMISKPLGFDWRSVDSGTWGDIEHGPFLTPEEKDQLAMQFEGYVS